MWFLIKGDLERLELFPTYHKVRVFAWLPNTQVSAKMQPQIEQKYFIPRAA